MIGVIVEELETTFLNEETVCDLEAFQKLGVPKVDEISKLAASSNVQLSLHGKGSCTCVGPDISLWRSKLRVWGRVLCVTCEREFCVDNVWERVLCVTSLVRLLCFLADDFVNTIYTYFHSSSLCTECFDVKILDTLYDAKMIRVYNAMCTL